MKILLVFIIITIVLGIIFFYLINQQHNHLVSSEDQEIKEFLVNDQRKLRKIIDESKFEDLKKQMNENYTYFYFPEECPSYKEDYLLYEVTKDGKKYYLPEKNTMIKLLKNNYFWTKKISGLFWSFNTNEQTSGQQVQECN